ncbi:hypothetical protein LOK49_LG06G01702 [Camellia lanceoleosa]|uniref:Uncharacterized protein n=1 Tax=Camellia lanceoleosa TaxID=1840588 RepID=A0ACC0HFG1_9ERIC|nr:hypothetical protein LOK49_LG06G01702 [Camellia lanceoleosa]
MGLAFVNETLDEKYRKNAGLFNIQSLISGNLHSEQGNMNRLQTSPTWNFFSYQPMRHLDILSSSTKNSGYVMTASSGAKACP